MDKSADADDNINWRRVRARRRFKAAVRYVIANRYWLLEDDSYVLRNLRKNVQVQAKKSKILTLEHKIILIQPAERRTEEEKNTLSKIIGFLKCFRKYPQHVKSSLAYATYFQYYGPGRVIVRQNHTAYAMYFIVSGEVEATITKRDDFGEDMRVGQMTLRSSDFFGDVSLLHGIPRSATITTLTNCEFLVLYKEDFDLILKDAALQEWLRILTALAKFTYFDDWSEADKRECCILAKVKTFEPDEIILGDGIGLKGYAHFVLSGTCTLIEHLLVHENYINGKLKRRFFTLEEEKPLKKKQNRDRGFLRSLNIIKTSTSSPSDYSEAKTSIPNKSEQAEEPQRAPSISTTKTFKSIAASVAATRKKSKEVNLGRKLEARNREDQRVASEILEVAKRCSELDDVGVFNLPDVETYFVQVCTFGEKACFGIGEYFQRRRVVALTPVKCLIIPKWWLTRGTNLWKRIIQYLDLTIPTSEEVFKEFLRGRRFEKFKKKLIKDLPQKPTWNRVENIPLSIRCTEPSVESVTY